MEILKKYPPIIEERLAALMRQIAVPGRAEICREAMVYSLGAGGKRIRPALVCAFTEMCGGDINAALDPACALEMIHTFSLIHDDLPCMDDDDLRRGKPSCHKQFDEAQALLAGDALECLAFEVTAAAEGLSDECRIKLIKCLGRAVGVCGMIGGQVIDVRNEGKAMGGEGLLEMYSLKTCALIKCACEMGCICGGREDLLLTADEYGECLGLAFQIVDDILDITSDEAVLGKPAGSDSEHGKLTYPEVFGIEKAREKAGELTKRAVTAAERLPRSEALMELTGQLLYRVK